MNFLEKTTKALFQIFLLFLAVVAGIGVGYLVGLSPVIHFFPQIIGYVNLAFLIFLIVGKSFNLLGAFDRVTPEVFFYACVFFSAVILGAGLLGGNWDQTPYWWARQGGFLPATDGKHYFTQVVNWPADWFDPINSRRPLNTTLNIFLFHLGGSTLFGVFLVKAALASIAVGIFIFGLASLIGRGLAISSGFALLFWTWPFVAVFLTEINSIIYSSAGIGILLLGIARKNWILISFGLAGFAIATSLRPINPLIHCVLAFCIVFQFSFSIHSKITKSFVLASATLVGSFMIGWGMPKLCHAIYGEPGSVLLGNTGHTLLGLVRGTNWFEGGEFFKSQYPDIPEAKANKLMHQMALEHFKNNPRIAFEKAWENTVYFSSEIYSEITHSIGFGYPALRILKTRLAGEYLYWIFVSLLILSCLIAYQTCPTLVILFATAFLSISGVVPLVYGDAGWRSIAGSFSIFTLFIPIGFIAVSRCFGHNKSALQIQDEANGQRMNCNPVFYSAILLGLVCVLSIFWPWLQREFEPASASKSPRIFTAEFKQGSHAKWTTWDKVVISPEVLINEVGIHEKMLVNPPLITNFLRRNLENIYGIQLVIGEGISDWIIVLKNTLQNDHLPKETELHPHLPKFKLKQFDESEK
jgi:hypothetical protein